MSFESVRHYLYRMRHLLVAMGVSFAAGLLLMSGLYYAADKQAVQQAALAAKLAEDNRVLVKQQAAFEVDASVLKSTNLALRKEADAQQEILAEQEKALDFYRQLMDPDSKQQGLALHSYVIQPLPESRQYYYRLTFVQYVKRRTTLKAQLKAAVHGQQNKQSATVDFSELVNNADKGWGKLRFRYFQVIEGQLTLPDDFTPERIQLTASVKKKRAKPWSRELVWQLGED